MVLRINKTLIVFMNIHPHVEQKKMCMICLETPLDKKKRNLSQSILTNAES